MSLGSGKTAIGRVVNVEDDPLQMGQAKVLKLRGHAVDDPTWEANKGEKLAWIPTMYPTTHAQHDQVGGGPAGYEVGSLVMLSSMDDHGQEWVITGTLPTGGKSQIDGGSQPDSSIPQMAKQEENNGSRQPRYGDKNSRIENGQYKNSIIRYAEEKGGPDRTPAKYPTIIAALGKHKTAITA